MFKKLLKSIDKMMDKIGTPLIIIGLSLLFLLKILTDFRIIEKDNLSYVSVLAVIIIINISVILVGLHTINEHRTIQKKMKKNYVSKSQLERLVPMDINPMEAIIILLIVVAVILLIFSIPVTEDIINIFTTISDLSSLLAISVTFIQIRFAYILQQEIKKRN